MGQDSVAAQDDMFDTMNIAQLVPVNIILHRQSSITGALIYSERQISTEEHICTRQIASKCPSPAFFYAWPLSLGQIRVACASLHVLPLMIKFFGSFYAVCVIGTCAIICGKLLYM